MYDNQRKEGTHENQGGFQIFVVFVHVLGIVPDRLPPVHSVEVMLAVIVLDELGVIVPDGLGIIVLDGLEVHPQGLLDAV